MVAGCCGSFHCLHLPEVVLAALLEALNLLQMCKLVVLLVLLLARFITAETSIGRGCSVQPSIVDAILAQGHTGRILSLSSRWKLAVATRGVTSLEFTLLLCFGLVVFFPQLAKPRHLLCRSSLYPWRYLWSSL